MSAPRILYIDDEPDIREIAVMSLELDNSLEVRACSGGQSALALIPGWQPDLILLDVMMPDIDGPTTLGLIRTLPGGASIPIVFITARAQQDDISSLLALGAVGVIPKPFDPVALAGQVHEFLALGRSAS